MLVVVILVHCGKCPMFSASCSLELENETAALKAESPGDSTSCWLKAKVAVFSS